MSSLRRALAHVGSVREAVLAAALPDPEEYLKLQTNSVLITNGHSATAAAVVSVAYDNDDDDNTRLLLADEALPMSTLVRADGQLIEETKRTLDGPLTASAVNWSWCRTWYLAVLIVVVALALLLVVWLLGTP